MTVVTMRRTPFWKVVSTWTFWPQTGEEEANLTVQHATISRLGKEVAQDLGFIRGHWIIGSKKGFQLVLPEEICVKLSRAWFKTETAFIHAAFYVSFQTNLALSISSVKQKLEERGSYRKWGVVMPTSHLLTENHDHCDVYVEPVPAVKGL